MAVEEPSVVAAVSGAAKTICGASRTGFQLQTSERNITIAQIVLLDIPMEDLDQVQKNVRSI